MEEKDYKLIEDYLDGNLDQDQVALFEKRLQDDQIFAEAFQVEKSMKAFLIKENNKEKILPQLEALGNKHFQEANVKPIKPNRNWITRGLAIAASIALLILAFNTFFQKSLYDQFANHTALNLVEKSDASQAATKAQEDFNSNDFQAAYESLEVYLNQNPDDTKALLAKGICALETDRYEEALTIFNQIQNNGGSAFSTTGTWYLALTYLKQNDLEKAKSYLLQIPDSDRLFKQTQDLIDKL